MNDFVPIKFGLLGGRYVTITPDAIDVSALTLEDVARGLSRIPRFGGRRSRGAKAPHICWLARARFAFSAWPSVGRSSHCWARV
jgi:hypothetical protein